MNLADYLILAVIGQIIWLTRKVSYQNSTLNCLRSKCPLLNDPKKEEEE
jgi:hypothetical protein